MGFSILDMKVIFVLLVCHLLLIRAAEPPFPSFQSKSASYLPLITLNSHQTFPSQPPLPNSLSFRNFPGNGSPFQSSSSSSQQQGFPSQNSNGGGGFQQPQFEGVNSQTVSSSQFGSLRNEYQKQSNSEGVSQQSNSEGVSQQSNNNGVLQQSDQFSQSGSFPQQQQQQQQGSPNFSGQSFNGQQSGGQFPNQNFGNGQFNQGDGGQQLRSSLQNGFQNFQNQQGNNNRFQPSSSGESLTSTDGANGNFQSQQQGGNGLNNSPQQSNGGGIFRDQNNQQQQSQGNEQQNSSGFQQPLNRFQSTESTGNFNNGFNPGFQQQQNGFQSQNPQQNFQNPQNNFQQQQQPNGQNQGQGQNQEQGQGQNQNGQFQSSFGGNGGNNGFLQASDGPQGQQGQGSPSSSTQEQGSSPSQRGRSSQNEIPDDNVVKGQYRVGLPDGRVQLVRYIALVTYKSDGDSSSQQNSQFSGGSNIGGGSNSFNPNGANGNSNNGNSNPFASASTKFGIIKLPHDYLKGQRLQEVQDKNSTEIINERSLVPASSQIVSIIAHKLADKIKKNERILDRMKRQ